MSISDLVLGVPLRVIPDFIRVNFALLALINLSDEQYDEDLHSRSPRREFMRGGGYPGVSSGSEGIGEVRSVFVGVEYDCDSYLFLSLGFVGVLGVVCEHRRAFCGWDAIGSLAQFRTAVVLLSGIGVASEAPMALLAELDKPDGLVYELFFVAISDELVTRYFSLYLVDDGFKGYLQRLLSDDRLRDDVVRRYGGYDPPFM